MSVRLDAATYRGTGAAVGVDADGREWVWERRKLRHCPPHFIVYPARAMTPLLDRAETFATKQEAFDFIATQIVEVYS